MFFFHNSIIPNMSSIHLACCLLSQVRYTRLKHPQYLHKTTPHDHKHKEGNKGLTQWCFIDMFPRLTNGNMSTFVDIFTKFGVSITDGSGCWLVFCICVCEKNGLLRNNNMVYVLSWFWRE